MKRTSYVSIRQTTGIKLLYTTIATVTMNLIVAVAILSILFPDVAASIYVEVVPHEQPF